MTEIKPLKRGQRVAVYERDERRIGSVRYTNDEGLVWVDFGREDCDGNGPDLYGMIGGLFHPRQCVRLRKRERRSLFAIADKGTRLVRITTGVYSNRHAAHANCPDGHEVVQFVEVRKREGT